MHINIRTEKYTLFGGYNFTEWQNGSGWEGTQWVIWPYLLLRQGHPRAHGSGLCPDCSWISPVRENLQPLWAICCIFVLSALSLWKWKHSMWPGSCGGRQLLACFPIWWTGTSTTSTQLGCHWCIPECILAGSDNKQCLYISLIIYA